MTINDGACHNKWNSGKLHGNISRNGYGNAIIGRYDGCFEEGMMQQSSVSISLSF